MTIYFLLLSYINNKIYKEQSNVSVEIRETLKCKGNSESSGMKVQIVNPNIANFVASIRDVGYTFEIAVADVIDNSLSAGAIYIEIYSVPIDDGLMLTLYDDGYGMDDAELKEAMRLATKNPNEERVKNDLGRFGLGLKTASFSQCKKLTVASKKNGSISVRCWDLDFIAKRNSWDLQVLEVEDIKDIPLFNKLSENESGTLVIWENIDRYQAEELSTKINDLSNHLSLVFHRFLEGELRNQKVRIILNNQKIEPHNPFNINHPATLKIPADKLSIYGKVYSVTPFILPHHTKVSSEEWQKYETEDGYIKAQGFYLYREKRLLTYGTWWGLHKAKDAHKLARIKIDITNDQDQYWGIDVKKSRADPVPAIKRELRRIVSSVTKTSFKPFKERGRIITRRDNEPFWELYMDGKQFSFRVNQTHPVMEQLIDTLSEEQLHLFSLLYKGLETFLPLQAIQAKMQSEPHSINQTSLTLDEVKNIVELLREKGFDEEWVERLKRTELLK